MSQPISTTTLMTCYGCQGRQSLANRITNAVFLSPRLCFSNYQQKRQIFLLQVLKLHFSNHTRTGWVSFTDLHRPVKTEAAHWLNFCFCFPYTSSPSLPRRKLYTKLRKNAKLEFSFIPVVSNLKNLLVYSSGLNILIKISPFPLISRETLKK